MAKLSAITRVDHSHYAWPNALTGAMVAAWRGPATRRWNTLRYKILALTIIGLVMLTAVGWALLAAHEVTVFRDTGSPAIINVLTPSVLQATASAPQPNRSDQINPAAWMPYWMVIDLLIFVALGLYLRWDLSRKS